MTARQTTTRKKATRKKATTKKTARKKATKKTGRKKTPLGQRTHFIGAKDSNFMFYTKDRIDPKKELPQTISAWLEHPFYSTEGIISPARTSRLMTLFSRRCISWTRMPS